MKTITTLLLALAIFSTGWAQYEINEGNFLPGKCYAKSMIPAVYEKVETSFPIYLGEDDPNLKLKKLTIMVRPPRQEYTQIQPGELTLIDVPAIHKTITIVKDTSQTNDYYWETFEEYLGPFEEGKLIWTEVICDNKRKGNFIQRLQERLAEAGFYPMPPEPLGVSGRFDTDTKKALRSFQEARQLPVGTLNIATLKALEIRY